MHVSESKPFILMEGSNLAIPAGIKTGELAKGNCEIPLRIVACKADVYEFIEKQSSEEGEMILSVPAKIIGTDDEVSVYRVDFKNNIALANLR